MHGCATKFAPRTSCSGYVKALTLQAGRQLPVIKQVFIHLNEFTGVQFRCMVANLGLCLLGSVMGMLFH